MSSPYLAEIRIVSFGFAPRNWAQCNGQVMSIAQNLALFTLLGTTYGGDGQTTFNLPNLQGRTPLHMGTGAGLSSYVEGQVGGVETITLTTSNMPTHDHALPAVQTVGTQSAPSGNVLAGAPGMYQTYNTPLAMGAGAMGNAGGGQAHTNLQPYLVLNFVIALAGIFPSRS